jgi:hypothetical protein
MKKIEKVDYLLSDLTRKEAEKKGKLKQWLKLNRHWEDYLKFKEKVLQSQQIYSEEAIQWLFANEIKNVDYWIELKLDWDSLTFDSCNILLNNDLQLHRVMKVLSNELFTRLESVLKDNPITINNNHTVPLNKIDFFLEWFNIHLCDDLSDVASYVAINSISNTITTMLTDNKVITRLTTNIVENFEHIIIDDHYLIKVR